jgi:3-oxoacyl-[acyl-carrier-protein] synthase-3
MGTGSYLPTRVLTNDELGKIIDASDDWIYERTGIRVRHIAADDEVTSDLAAHAVRRALEMAQVRPDEVDLLVVATITPDMPMPACAAFLAKKLELRHVMAFDVSAASAGFVYALSTADQFIRAGQCRRVVVVGAELLSRVVDWSDRATCILFGDGAGAVVMGPSDEVDGGEILSTRCYMDGSSAMALSIPGGGSQHPASAMVLANKLNSVKMYGTEMFRVAVRMLTACCKDALARHDMAPSEIAWVVPHQANVRIIQAVTQRVGVPMEKCFTNLERVGNTSAASMPIALDEANRTGRLARGDNLLLCALGAGVAWGSAVVRW